MRQILLAVAVMVAGAFLSLLLRKSPRILRFTGPFSVIAGCITGIIPAVTSLVSGESFELNLPWQMPFGSLNFTLDPLSAFFAVPILIVCALSALYGSEYTKPSEGTRNMGLHWFLFNLLTASMVVVVLARNAVLFLLAWEIMSLSSFLLVMFEGQKEEVRRAGWIYLVATHIGTAFLLILFILLGSGADSFDFDKFHAGESVQLAGFAFLLAVIGFGTKAGFMPMHVWLPEAHPAAPSHVSAVMSGVMIKTGIYGILRILIYLGQPPAWWGWLLVFIGVVSGILGVLFALAQHDLKRLLAYHSVENIGIISLGMGVGLLGITWNSPIMIFAGFAGALLHVFNHAIFKSLLFLSAGSVLHATGTREIDHLGGLLKKMPSTAIAFVIGSVAICGLPPLNGFVSEFLIYVGAFSGVAGTASAGTAGNIAGLVVVISLALIGGLAIACFTKAFGIVFLGEGRTKHTEHAHEAGLAMRVPMMTLAAICLIVGLAGPFIPDLLMPVVKSAVPIDFCSSGNWLSQAGNVSEILWGVTAGAAILLVLTALVALARSALVSGKNVPQTVTWDCGYARPTSRMQYTSSSFAAPITKLFSFFLGTRNKSRLPEGLFPKSASFSSQTPDLYRERIYKPAFIAVESGLAKFRWLQHGRLNFYILCIVIALITLLAWKLR